MRNLIFLIVFVLSQVAVGQSTGSIYGRITDANMDGEPLIFASVALKDTPIGEQTNFHGNFEMTGIPEGSHVLQIRYLGYEPKEISIQVTPGKIVHIEESLEALSTTTESLLLTEVSMPPSASGDKVAKQ